MGPFYEAARNLSDQRRENKDNNDEASRAPLIRVEAALPLGASSLHWTEGLEAQLHRRSWDQAR